MTHNNKERVHLELLKTVTFQLRKFFKKSNLQIEMIATHHVIVTLNNRVCSGMGNKVA